LIFARGSALQCAAIHDIFAATNGIGVEYEAAQVLKISRDAWLRLGRQDAVATIDELLASL